MYNYILINIIPDEQQSKIEKMVADDLENIEFNNHQ